MSLKSKLALRFLLGLVVFGALLFIPAGSLRFWQGWAYLMVWFVPTLFAFCYFCKHDPQLIERRSGEEIRFHPTRFYGLDADSELIQFKSHAFAPAFQRPLRRVIDGVERNRQESANRSRIDEQSASLRSRVRHKLDADQYRTISSKSRTRHAGPR
jgi:hypothetical protein